MNVKNMRNDLVPWPIVLVVLCAIILMCSSSLTLLTDIRETAMNKRTPSTPYPEETTDLAPDVTLAPRERTPWGGETETRRPVDFFDSVITRLKYN